jgi:ABC-type phosphate transport system ATPase subunit
VRDDDRRVREMIRNVGASEAEKLDQFIRRSPKLATLCERIADKIEQVGTDPAILGQAQREMLMLLRSINDAERAINTRIRDLEKEHR